MGATKNNIVIGIMVLIITCLSLSLYRVTRLSKVLYEVRDRVPVRIPLDVFVTGLAEAVEQHNLQSYEVAAQNRWLRRHLEQTLHKLETDYKLDPIPVKTAYPSPGTILYEYDAEPDKFVLPYQKREDQFYIPDPNYSGLVGLTCYIEASRQSIGFSIGDTEFWIVNFYERLQRLEQVMEAAKKKEIN